MEKLLDETVSALKIKDLTLESRYHYSLVPTQQFDIVPYHATNPSVNLLNDTFGIIPNDVAFTCIIC